METDRPTPPVRSSAAPTLPSPPPTWEPTPSPTADDGEHGQRVEKEVPVIRISIGRIEVRSTPPVPTRPEPAPTERRTPLLPLDEYLERRNRRNGGRP
jgi:hypothetical protein